MNVPIKVMLVDDEIMALNNLYSMIDWEPAGFKVAAKETNPKKALETFSRLRPQIIFIDIMMPVMNGLELSKKILLLDIPVKIVILTSYKDFSYAKTAIEVGIANYLVKHEVNELTLTTELKRLQKELVEEKNNEETIRHRLLRSLIDNTFSRKIEGKKIINRYLNFKTDKLLFLFFKVDIPYRFDEEARPCESEKFIFLLDEIKAGNIEMPSDIFGINTNKSVVVVYLEKNTGKEVIDKIVTNLFIKIQKQLAYKNITVSAYSVVTGINMADIVGINLLADRAFEYSIYLGRGRIIKDDDIFSVPDSNDPEMEVSFHTIKQNISDLDPGSVAFNLDRIFEVIYTNKWNPPALRKIFNYLVRILNEFLRSNYFPLVGSNEFEDIFQIDKTDLFQLDDILKWFKNLFSASINKVKEGRSKHYSRKVALALEFIQKNYMNDWAVEDISRKLNISEVYLRKIFKAETGTTIVNYLTDLRMVKAIALLKTDNYKVFQISEMVGYNTSQYFSKVFKKYTGKSPVDFILRV